MPLNEADPNNLLMHVNKFLERIHAMSSLTINDLKQAILGDPVLKSALTGPAGLNGELIQNYGGSLFSNLSAEFNTTVGWVGATLSEEKIEGVSSISGLNFGLTKRQYIRTDRLYKLQLHVKGSGNFSAFFFETKDQNGGFVVRTNGTSGIYFISNLTLNNSFQKLTKYVGGIGEGSTNFPQNSFTTKIGFACGSTCYVAKTTLKEVDLGEPVPFNLPFLPDGQMVFDPTDGSVGRYDGTTIHWFTMA